MLKTPLALTLLCTLTPSLALAQVDARMLRYPDVSAQQITFVYAGDIWVVSKDGGTAQRLSSPSGEESFPRFSPDGASIAFSANYAGNTDIYVIPSMGGVARRLTSHPNSDRMLDWYPDGRSLLIATSRESGRQRFRQLYKLSAEGGLPEKLPLSYGEFGSISPDGRYLTFMTKTRDFRTWKRYRGGLAPDIWLYDFDTGRARKLTTDAANDSHPMWHGEKLYFLSDRGPYQRFNIWAHDLNSSGNRQITEFRDHDIQFPAIGPDDLVFGCGGRLYRLSLPREELVEVEIQIVTDTATLQPRIERASELIQWANISPSGKRALFQVRGEVMTVPAEHGPILNLTQTSGIAERSPAWSPDGKTVAYFSDRTGEYELTIRAADGSGLETTLSELGPGFRYEPVWAPDNNKLAFIDQTMTIQVFDIEKRQVSKVSQQKWQFHGGLSSFVMNWSPDSRWLAFAGDQVNRQRGIFIYDSEEEELIQATSGYYDDRAPVFDPEGKQLFYLSGRDLQPSYSDLDTTFIYANSYRIVAVPLAADTPSLMAPRNDSEADAEENLEDTGTKKKDDKSDEEEDREKAPDPVVIAFEGFERRGTVLPPAAGQYGTLSSAPGKVIFLKQPLAGAPRDAKSDLMFYDSKEREEKTIIKGIDDYVLAAAGENLLVVKDDQYAILEVEPDQKMEKILATDGLEVRVDPRAEWRQIFDDVWRFQRDYFYDTQMHGVDWEAQRRQYGELLGDAITRRDVNFVIGEMIGELNASHTYRGGGDQDNAEQRQSGLLGIDWELVDGTYRIERIITAAPWDLEVRSPLQEPGINVDAGDYVLAVNGIRLATARDPWAAFDGLAESTVSLTVNDQPTLEGARRVTVVTLNPTQASRLRHLAWIESNRQRVDKATNGRAGYIYVQSTGVLGQTELVRQFMHQFRKEALIIDERFNSGGQIPDRFVELLNRRPLAYWAVRDGQDWAWPPIAHSGPKVMLINGWSGSGGDAFPDYFRTAGLGPLIGERTWGGLIGVTGLPGLVDGGRVTSPTFRQYSPEGEWFSEGHGVDPDIEVLNNPADLARGQDAQLDRAIEEILVRLAAPEFSAPQTPSREDRSSTGGIR